MPLCTDAGSKAKVICCLLLFPPDATVHPESMPAPDLLVTAVAAADLLLLAAAGNVAVTSITPVCGCQVSPQHQPARTWAGQLHQ